MVGERLAELRTKKNMTQEEFADYMGVTRQSVSKWELDKTFPDVEKLIRISELYDVSIDYILKGVVPEKNEVIITESQPEKNEVIVTESQPEAMVCDSESQEEGEPDIPKKSTGRAGLIISILITCTLAVLLLVFIGFCLIQNNWTGSSQVAVKVEKVYEQLSFVQVGCYNEEGIYVSENIFLDNEGIRPGDYIYTDVNGADISVDYNIWTIMLPVLVLVLLVIMLVLQIKELKRHE